MNDGDSNCRHNTELKLRSRIFGQIFQTTGLILGLHAANERRRYKVTPSLIGWVQT